METSTTITFNYLLLQCFSCDKAFDPFHEGLTTLILTDQTAVGHAAAPNIWPLSTRAFSIAPQVLELADARGWRKVTLYGRTLYICPDCRAKRTRPEWEQRLTDPPLAGAKVLEDPEILTRGIYDKKDPS